MRTSDALRNFQLTMIILLGVTAPALAETVPEPAQSAPTEREQATDHDVKRIFNSGAPEPWGSLETVRFQDPAPLSPSDPLSPQTNTPSTSPSILGTPNFAARSRSSRIAFRGNRRAPAMIGDFFGTSSGTLVIPGTTISGSIPFSFVNRGFGESVPIAPSLTSPVSFPILGTNVGGVSIPSTLFVSVDSNGNTINNGQIGTLSPGSSFLLNSGSDAYRVAREAVIVNQLGNGDGEAELTGGQATLNVPDSDNSLPVTSGDQFFVEQFFNYTSPDVVVDLPSVAASGGGVVGRQKIAENTSPMPRDRIFHNYSYFTNVPFNRQGVNVSRYAPGFEKTFFNGESSFEMRMPMAVTLDNDIFADGSTNTQSTELGNMTMTFKSLLYLSQVMAISAGFGMTVPTAEDLQVYDLNYSEVLHVSNRSVHLMPFLGGLYTPNDDLFVQGFVQADFDSNGNPVSVDNGTGLSHVGRINDATLLYVDLSVGYWLYRSDELNQFLTGIAPTVEMHYNRSLQDSDVIHTSGLQIGNFTDSIEIWNGVVGVNFELFGASTATIAYSTPLGSGSDRQFDGELRLLYNLRFGAPNRQNRVY